MGGHRTACHRKLINVIRLDLFQIYYTNIVLMKPAVETTLMSINGNVCATKDLNYKMTNASNQKLALE